MPTRSKKNAPGFRNAEIQAHEDVSDAEEGGDEEAPSTQLAPAVFNIAGGERQDYKKSENASHNIPATHMSLPSHPNLVTNVPTLLHHSTYPKMKNIWLSKPSYGPVKSVVRSLAWAQHKFPATPGILSCTPFLKRRCMIIKS